MWKLCFDQTQSVYVKLKKISSQGFQKAYWFFPFYLLFITSIQQVCKGMKEQEEVSFGLLFIILTEPSNASKVSLDCIIFFLVKCAVCHIMKQCTNLCNIACFPKVILYNTNYLPDLYHAAWETYAHILYCISHFSWWLNESNNEISQSSFNIVQSQTLGVRRVGFMLGWTCWTYYMLLCTASVHVSINDFLLYGDTTI